MREHPDIPLPSKPSPRQAIAIPDLLSSKKMRHGFIQAKDFIQAAVVTSYPDNQAIARRIAMEIIFGERSEEEERSKDIPYPGVKRGSYDNQGNASLSGSSVEVKAKVYDGQGEASQFRKGLSSGGIGSGDERFREWRAKFYSNKEYRYKLMRAAEKVADKIVVESNSKCEHTFLTKEDSGPLEGYKLRYFQLGDDPDLVDFEETIQNISGRGKGLSELRYDDFITRERRGRKGAVVFLQDISGSMERVLKEFMVYSVILVYAYALCKYEIALAFFESDAYVVKRLFDGKNADDLIEEMLEAKSMLGTRGGEVLKWGRDQLANVDGRYYERVCFILSDLGFSDVGRVVEEIKTLVSMEVRVTIILPPPINDVYYYFDYKNNLEAIRKTNCIVIESDSLENELCL
jgi:hypothetical protein